MKHHLSEFEFSRSVPVESLPDDGRHVDLNAKPEERQRLAERFGLLGLDRLEAQLHLTKAKGGTEIEIEGELHADVVQQCVVTLEPLPAHVSCEVKAVAVPQRDLHLDITTLIAPDDDITEPIHEGHVDLGEIVAQHLGASLDPYPRKPGVPYVEVEYGQKTEAKVSPLAVLATLKTKPKK